MAIRMLYPIILTLADNIIKSIQKTKYSVNKCLFVCGPMGSGKSTFIKTNLVNHPIFGTYYYSSIDDLVPLLDNRLDVRQKYLISREVGIIVTDYLLDNNISMIIEGTGVNHDMIDYLDRLRNKGYQIATYFLKTELEVCRDRVKDRNTKQVHQVLDEDVVSYYQKLWQTETVRQSISRMSDRVCYVHNYGGEEIIDCGIKIPDKFDPS